MKKLIVCFSLFAIASVAFTQSADKNKMSVTTSSEAAKKLYNEAIVAMEDVYVQKSLNLIKESLKKDPDFFMANYQLAIINLYMGNEKEFKEYSGKAVNCQAKLSEGELLLKDVLKRFREKKDANVTDIGKKLIALFPKDVNSYNNQVIYQILIKDYEGEIKTLKSAIGIAERPAPLYNMLGYAYMSLNQFNDAAIALDKYIELAPKIPNPYDSKGDYYMKIKDYNNAYKTYMKAHKIDSLWGYKKAMNAKAIADSLAKK